MWNMKVLNMMAKCFINLLLFIWLFRCACVKNFGAPLAGNVGNEKGTNRGDLDNPNLHEYEGCGPTANSCKILEI